MHQSVQDEVLPLLLLLCLASAHLPIDPVTFKTGGRTVTRYEYCMFGGQRLVKHDSSAQSGCEGEISEIVHPRV